MHGFRLHPRPVSNLGIDPDLDADQLLGRLSADILRVLWPGFIAQNLEVWVNPVYLRRHLAGRMTDYVERVAFFNQQARGLAQSFRRAVAVVRYDRVPTGQAGLTVFVELPPNGRSTAGFMAMGLRIFPPQPSGRSNHVTTIMRVSEAKVRRVLQRSPHVFLPAGGADVDGAGGEV